MKKIKVGDKIEVEITKITVGRDSKVYVTIGSDMFSNKPTLIVKDEKFFWESSGEITIK